jgi:hypothetical protein
MENIFLNIIQMRKILGRAPHFFVDRKSCDKPQPTEMPIATDTYISLCAKW